VFIPFSLFVFEFFQLEEMLSCHFCDNAQLIYSDNQHKNCIKSSASLTDIVITTVYLRLAGLTRPAPAEPSQGGNAARVSGCSGAM
jgi:hypothetical protein